MKRILADAFPQQIQIRQGYGEFFEDVRRLATGCEPDGDLGEALRRHAQRFLADCDLRDFRDFCDATYGRIYLGRDAATGWEAIMMCWRRGNSTSVHGHPQFAAYNFASGRFRVEVFEKGTDGSPVLVDTLETGAGEGFFALGRAGRCDNHIHRITCLSDEGHSLHIYSDDARRGVVFDTDI